MRRTLLFLLLALPLAGCRTDGPSKPEQKLEQKSEQRFKQKFVYTGGNLMYDETVLNAIELIEKMEAAGATHLIYNDYQTGYLAALPPRYFYNAEKVRLAAEKAGVTIVPTIFPFGMSGRYLYHNPNLADSLPIRDMRFIVNGTEANADPALALDVKNASFDELVDGKPVGWTLLDPPDMTALKDFLVESDSPPQEPLVLDTEIRHSGAASLRLGGGMAIDRAKMRALPREERGRFRGGNIGAKQTIKVKPFHKYVLRVWIKTEGFDSVPRHPLPITGARDGRSLCWAYFMHKPSDNPLHPESIVGTGVNTYFDFGIKGTQDWQEFVVAFNSLDYDEIELTPTLSPWSRGKMWFDDISVEPAGLLNVVRRELTPVVVTSEETGVVYHEGIDFKRVEDPLLGRAPTRGDFMVSSRGTFEMWHTPPPIRLTENSSIKDGERLLVSFYSPEFIYIKQQVTVSISDPAIYDLMEEEIKLAHHLWKSSAYMMSHDEIRSGGWEPQPNGETLTPGELLARHIPRALEIAKRHAPDADFYVWSDMFDPRHNARVLDEGQYFYLVNGSWAGSWDGLPKELIIMNWNGGRRSRESLKWFADRGNRQIISGNVEGDNFERVKGGLNSRLTSAEGLPGIIGYSYTTWTGTYELLGEFFDYVEAWEPEKKEQDPIVVREPAEE